MVKKKNVINLMLWMLFVSTMITNVTIFNLRLIESWWILIPTSLGLILLSSYTGYTLSRRGR